MQASHIGRVVCSKCKVILRIDRIHEKRTAPCPKCGHDIRVPDDLERTSPSSSNHVDRDSKPNPRFDAPFQKPILLDALETLGRLPHPVFFHTIRNTLMVMGAIFICGTGLALYFIFKQADRLPPSYYPMSRQSHDIEAALSGLKAQVQRLKEQNKSLEEESRDLANSIQTNLGVSRSEIEKVLPAFEAQDSKTKESR